MQVSNPQLSTLNCQLSTQKNSYPPTITGLKDRCARGLGHGRGCCNSYHTPTVTPTTQPASERFCKKNEISQQSKDSHQIPHLLPLRIKTVPIKEKYIFLSRENFLAGLPVKNPCCQHSANHSRNIRRTLRNTFTFFHYSHSSFLIYIVGVW